jgi:cytoskeletal protein CcmA (bactofilin family)
VWQDSYAFVFILIVNMTKDKSGAGPSSSIIIKDTLISGNLSVLSDIRIDGIIDGNLSSNSKVFIGTSGQVLGNISCKNALIEGKVSGNITVNAVLDIRGTAQIDGDILSSILILEENAIFNGKCTIKTEMNSYAGK